MLSPIQRVYITQLTANAEELARAIRTAGDLVAIFFDRQYDQATGVTDEDLAEFDLNRQTVSEYVQALNQLLNWHNNQPVTRGEWGKVLNRVRRLI